MSFFFFFFCRMGGYIVLIKQAYNSWFSFNQFLLISLLAVTTFCSVCLGGNPSRISFTWYCFASYQVTEHDVHQGNFPLPWRKRRRNGWCQNSFLISTTWSSLMRIRFVSWLKCRHVFLTADSFSVYNRWLWKPCPRSLKILCVVCALLRSTQTFHFWKKLTLNLPHWLLS